MLKWLLALGIIWCCDAQAQSHHTSPACWDEPRIYSPLGEEDNYEMLFSHGEGAVRASWVVSPNDAYSFEVARPVFDERSQEFRTHVLVHTERSYLLRLTFPSVRDVADVRWINERLLYIRAWRGRIAGSDFIVDVESEAIVHQEPFRWGAIGFEQYKACLKPAFRDSLDCLCDDATATVPKTIVGAASASSAEKPQR